MREKLLEVIKEVNSAILGKEREVKEIAAAIIAGGNVLLEDIPGVGKTTMALAFAKSMGVSFKRVQFTPDVMPSDITGFSVYNREKGAFEYREGAVFCNIFLADELNRTSPKTQSALLEAMEEKSVTVDGQTRKLPLPFSVIATINPLGSVGTQKLPESQTDRFTISLSLGYPDYESELKVAMETAEGARSSNVKAVTDIPQLLKIREEVEKVYIKENVYRYILDIVTATRKHAYVDTGASPRATVDMVKMSKAAAYIDGRDFVTPEDVRQQVPYVLKHRLYTNASAKIEDKTGDDILKEIVEGIKVAEDSKK